MRVKFWGVRGSIPAPLTTDQLQDRLFRALSGAGGVDLSSPAAVQAYIAGLSPVVSSVVGGNTACVEVDSGDAHIIVDCGSGIRGLGLALMSRGFGRGLGTAHILLSHAHWDHLMGFPFFAPAYVPGNKLIFYAVNADPRAYLSHQQSAPTYFPIGLGQMEADFEYRQLSEEESIQIGRTSVASLALNHPGGAHAFRFDDGESVFVYASDGEYRWPLPPDRLRAVRRFFSNADALAFDAQYSQRDALLSRADWGHSSAIIGVDLAGPARVKSLITVHHDPIHSDEQIHAIAAAARHWAAVRFPGTEVLVGAEGLEMFLGRSHGLETLTEKAEALWTLVLAGELGANTAPQAAAALRAALEAAPGGRVMVDLARCAAPDSGGLRTLLAAAGAAPRSRLALFAPDEQMRRTLETLPLPDNARTYYTRRQARSSLLAPTRLVRADQALLGGYRLHRILFTGDAGAVYSGECLADGRPVVAQVVGGGPDDPLRALWEAELDIWRNLRHPRLAVTESLVQESDWFMYVCPRPPGISLSEWLAAGQPLAARLQLACDLTDTLAYVHRQGLFHGSLTPEHIAVQPAAPGTDPAPGGVSLARLPLFSPGHPFGQAAYRAPEHIRDRPPIQRTDVYLLGMVLYEILVGVHPFDAESEDLMTTLQIRGSPESPRLRWPEIPAELEFALLKMLALDPSERYPSAAEMHEELRRLKEISLSAAGAASGQPQLPHQQ